jgi:hypothetical protein
MGSLILLLLAFIHSPSAFSQVPEVQTQQPGAVILPYGQTGILQIGPNGMDMVVPNSQTGSMSTVPLIDNKGGFLVPSPAPALSPAPEFAGTNELRAQQAQATAQREALAQQQSAQPQAVTCNCSCPPQEAADEAEQTEQEQPGEIGPTPASSWGN